VRAPSAATEGRFTLTSYTQDVAPSGRYLFYSHDGLGLGHVRRNLSVATALAALDPAASILLATSAEEAQQFAIPPTVDILKLPGLRKIENDRYAARRLNVTWPEVRSVRASLLLAAVDSFRPTVLLADRHPLGVGGELEPALRRVRENGGSAVLGLRDVLDDPATVDNELRGRRLYDRIAEYYDQVLVYGQADILDSRREYDFPADIAAMTRFCGYVVSNGTRAPNAGDLTNGHRPDSRPHVVATAGGGEDGFALLATFVEAAVVAGWQATLVSGPHAGGPRLRKLRARASKAGVAFQRFVPGLSAQFPTLDALVCMGGYNTLTEAAASGVPTVCVPRIVPRIEQLIRARAFAGRGLLTLLEPADLDATSLAGGVEWAMARALGANRSARPLDLTGAYNAARHLLGLAAEKPPVARPSHVFAVR